MSVTIRFEGKTKLKKKLQGVIDEMTRDLTEEIRKTTPIDTGKARRGWRRTMTPKGASIHNSVDYVSHLENGSSRQAPKGMIQPAINKIEANLRSGKYNRKRGRK
jgi:hypothetical protein